SGVLTESQTQRVGGRQAYRLLERFDEGDIWRRALHLVAAASAVHHAASSRLQHQLLRQPGLADAGLAADENDRAMAGDRLLHEAAELGALRFSADVGCALREDGSRRNGGRFLLPGDLEQAPTLREAFESEAAAVAELKVFGGADDASDSFGSKDLTASGLRANSSGGVDCRAEDISIFVDSLSGVEADAHLDLLLGRLCAIAIGERTLHGDGAGQGTAGRDEGGHKAVAERLDLSAAMGLHLLTQEIEMTAHELLSGSIAL